MQQSLEVAVCDAHLSSVDLRIGHDISIGYLSHIDAAVRLYLQETFTFLLLTTEAAVALAPASRAGSKSSQER